MDRIKLIDEELALFQTHAAEEVSYGISHTITSANLASSRIVGLETLIHEKRFLLCMNDAVYIIEDSEAIAHLSFNERHICCCAYISLKVLSGQTIHVFFMDNNTIELHEIIDKEIICLEKLAFPKDIRFKKGTGQIFLANTGTIIYFTFDHHNVFAWNVSDILMKQRIANFKKVYSVYDDELLFFAFLKERTSILTVARCAFNGMIAIERASMTNGTYLGTSRSMTGSQFDCNYLYKQVNDELIVLLSTEHTILFTAAKDLTKFTNNGLPHEILVYLHCVFESSDRILLEACLASGRIFQAQCSAIPKQNDQVIWTGGKSLSRVRNEKFKFITRLHNEVYLTASDTKGISVHYLRENYRRKVQHCSYSEEMYFDSAILPSKDEETEYRIFCGAYNRHHGFLKWRRTRRNDLPVRVLWSRKLKYVPVSNVWLSEGVLVYESFGQLYDVHSDAKICEFSDGIWITKGGVTVTDVECDILSIGTLLGPVIMKNETLVQLKKCGKLEIMNYSKERTECLFQCELADQIHSTSVAAAYSSDNSEFHILISQGYDYLSFFHNKNCIRKVQVSRGFHVSDLLIKRVLSKLYYIATSTAGGCLVYTADSAKPILEIKGNGSAKSHIFDIGSEATYILIYSSSDQKIVDLAQKAYRKIDLPVRPYQIIRNYDEKDQESSFYILDYDWCLSLISCDISQVAHVQKLENMDETRVLDIGGFIPLQILTMNIKDQALVVMTKSPKTNISILDFDSMKVVGNCTLGTNCRNIILRALWNDACEVESYIDFIMQKTVLVYFIKENVAHFKIIRIQKNVFVSQQDYELPCRALFIKVDHEKNQVHFDGSSKQVYNIFYDSSADRVSLKLSPNTQETAAPYHGGAVKSAYKEIEGNFFQETPSHERQTHVTACAIMRSFFTSGYRNNVPRAYDALIDYRNCVSLYRIFRGVLQGEDRTSFIGRFNINSKVTNISPVPYSSKEAHSTHSRLESGPRRTPLFVVTCADGTIFTLTEVVKGRSHMYNED